MPACVLPPFPTRRSSDLGSPASFARSEKCGDHRDALQWHPCWSLGGVVATPSQHPTDPSRTCTGLPPRLPPPRAEEHTSELQSPCTLVCRLLLEKNKELH